MIDTSRSRERETLRRAYESSKQELEEFEEITRLLRPYMEGHPDRTVGEALSIMERTGAPKEQIAKILGHVARNPVFAVPRRN